MASLCTHLRSLRAEAEGARRPVDESEVQRELEEWQLEHYKSNYLNKIPLERINAKRDEIRKKLQARAHSFASNETAGRHTPQKAWDSSHTALSAISQQPSHSSSSEARQTETQTAEAELDQTRRHAALLEARRKRFDIDHAGKNMAAETGPSQQVAEDQWERIVEWETGVSPEEHQRQILEEIQRKYMADKGMERMDARRMCDYCAKAPAVYLSSWEENPEVYCCHTCRADGDSRFCGDRAEFYKHSGGQKRLLTRRLSGHVLQQNQASSPASHLKRNLTSKAMTLAGSASSRVDAGVSPRGVVSRVVAREEGRATRGPPRESELQRTADPGVSPRGVVSPVVVLEEGRATRVPPRESELQRTPDPGVSPRGVVSPVVVLEEGRVVVLEEGHATRVPLRESELQRTPDPGSPELAAELLSRIPPDSPQSPSLHIGGPPGDTQIAMADTPGRRLRRKTTWDVSPLSLLPPTPLEHATASPRHTGASSSSTPNKRLPTRSKFSSPASARSATPSKPSSPTIARSPTRSKPSSPTSVAATAIVASEIPRAPANAMEALHRELRQKLGLAMSKPVAVKRGKPRKLKQNSLVPVSDGAMNSPLVQKRQRRGRARGSLAGSPDEAESGEKQPRLRVSGQRRRSSPKAPKVADPFALLRALQPSPELATSTDEGICENTRRRPPSRMYEGQRTKRLRAAALLGA